MNNKEKGDLGEFIACGYLLQKGADIIESKYRIKTGEIDLIAKIDNELVFIEVKARNNIKFGTPSQSVNYKKVKKIVDTSKYYLLKNNLNDVPIRFDVIEVYLKENRINHIENAF